MKVSSAKRVKAVRELLGITRQAFCDLVGIDYLRIASLENDRSRLVVDELATLDAVIPEFTSYLLHGKELKLMDLQHSENELVRFAAMQIQSGQIPEGYGLEEVIVDGSQGQ